MEDNEEKQLKADIMRKTMQSMDTRARTEVTIMAELIALRAWKAKAMPFLEYLIELGFRSDIQINLEEGHFKQLTELLGGDDE